MHDPALHPFSGNDSTTESWLHRVRENLGQLLIPSHFKPSSANGAPIHLLKLDESLRPARAQGASLITHAAVFAAIVFLLASTKGGPKLPFSGETTPVGPYRPSAALIRSLTNAQPSGGRGSGGDQNPIPATRGDSLPRSPIVLVKPTLPQNERPQLPEPPAIFDSNAAAVLTPNGETGLPWMPDDTNSAGPGKGHGIGSKDGDTIGDGGIGPGGDGTGKGPYGPGFIPPGCAYCPYPTYTDEARHGKVQGAVTLAVLVGADGRAQDIRIVKGIGFGLDERAIETVRGWKFVPARDGAKHAVAAWVTVEAVFRLF
jgi:periplasmic protein TonB